MSEKIIVEVCAGSLEDCLAAQKGGADRIELNNGIHMGGLTPSIGTVKAALDHTDIPIIAMVRPRGGGFCYDDTEVETMRIDAQALLDEGVDGLVFGFLNNDKTVNKTLTKEFVEHCHKYHKEAIFHRAFDVVKDPIETIESLIECGVDRILTSGLKAQALDGIELLKTLQDTYGDRIEFCLGSGINIDNVETLIAETGIHQVHASFKSWCADETSATDDVSYRYSDSGDYEISDVDKIEAFVNKLEKGD